MYEWNSLCCAWLYIKERLNEEVSALIQVLQVGQVINQLNL